jgi:GNAT superfamily N-acetyltransferase
MVTTVLDGQLDVDGHRLSVARMRPELGAALAAFHDALSPATVRNRFFTLHPHLSAAEVAWFCGVDHRDREAIVVMDGELIVAVARFDRLAAAPSRAEAAFVVADDWQHRGLGSALLQLLAARAREVGVEELVADTLVSNRAMQSVFRHGGMPTRASFDGGVTHVTVRVGPPAAPVSPAPAGAVTSEGAQRGAGAPSGTSGRGPRGR